jgi:hypothetical protein
MKRMIQTEELENKSIEAIASQVRDALSKVRSKRVKPRKND